MTPAAPCVLWKGRDIAALPARDLRAHLHSVYARACNIQLEDGRLLALLDSALPRIGWGAGVANLSRPFTSFLRAGMPCRLSAAGLHVELCEGAAFTLSWDKAPLWAADHLYPTGPASPAALHCLYTLAAAQGWPGWTALGLFFAENHNNFVETQHDSVAQQLVSTDIFCSRAANVCRTLAAAWQHGTAAKVNAAACGLVGLGIGLTPSGDDFLGGLLAGLRATATPEQQKRLVRPLCAALHMAAQHTGAVAAAFLRHACRHSFSHTLRAVAQLLHIPVDAAEEQQVQHRRALEQAAQALLAFGSTSGADTLAGLMFAGHLTEKTV